MPWQPKSKPKRKPKVVKKQLADGSIRVYEYERASKATAPPERDTVGMLIEAYQGSPEWKRLSAGTQDRYIRYMRPLMGIANQRAANLTRRDITTIRNAINDTGRPAAANAFVRATSVLFAWGVENEWVEVNPTLRIKAIPGGHFPAWTPDITAVALDVLPEHLRRMVLLALYTGQRRGDLCRMAWSHYDGTRIRLTQGKTGVPMVIPVHPVLKAEMDGWERKALTILINGRGWPWKPESASVGMKRAIDRLELPKGWNIHGLRKLAAANLAEAGCSAMEIAAITGHKTLQMVQFYAKSADQERMATAAIHRLPVRKI